ncbi:MAG: FecR domain-containing protein [bacterium]
MPDHPASPDWDTLARFIAGECTPEESRELERRLESDPAQAALLHALDAVVRAADPEPPTHAEVESALAAVLVRRGAARDEAPPRRGTVVSLDAYRSRWRDARLAAAAAVLVVVGAGLVWRTALSPRSGGLAAGTPMRYATAIGVMDSLQLPDGTRVLLGPGSVIELARDFGSLTRELTLAGEARFAVVHDAAHPFTVHTKLASFRDVGTVFSVHSDEADGARIVVSEGSVSVRGAPGSAASLLAAGDRGTIAPSGVMRVEHAGATSDDLAWTAGRLVFRDASVAQVTADVRRWYGIELRVDPALAGRRLSTTFTRADAALDVGRTVAAALGGGLREEGGVLHIVSPPAAPPAR